MAIGLNKWMWPMVNATINLKEDGTGLVKMKPQSWKVAAATKLHL